MNFNFDKEIIVSFQLNHLVIYYTFSGTPCAYNTFIGIEVCAREKKKEKEYDLFSKGHLDIIDVYLSKILYNYC